MEGKAATSNELSAFPFVKLHPRLSITMWSLWIWIAPSLKFTSPSFGSSFPPAKSWTSRTFPKASYITKLTCRAIIEPNNARDVRSKAQQTSPDQTKLYIIKTIFLLILCRWEIFLHFPSKKEIQLRRKRSTLCSGCGRCDGNGDKLPRMRNGWLLIV